MNAGDARVGGLRGQALLHPNVYPNRRCLDVYNARRLELSSHADKERLRKNRYVRKPRVAITFHVRSLITLYVHVSPQAHLHVSNSLFTINAWILSFVISHCSVNKVWQTPYIHRSDIPSIFWASLFYPLSPRELFRVLSACGVEGREGLASIHNRLTNQILLSRTGKQLVHNFERTRSTLGSTSVALISRKEPPILPRIAM